MSLLHQIALTQVKDIGVIAARILIEHFGSAQAIFEASEGELTSVVGLRKNSVKNILSRQNFERAEEELIFVEKYKIKTLFYTEDNYPQRLKACNDAPPLIYYKGNTDLNKRKVISIVGTRKATPYGKEICDRLISDLQSHDVLVVSGLAHGIDGMAHRACVKNNVSTIGVLGHGLDRIYPAAHRDLAESMLENGGILSEFPSKTIANPENFPKRNRIIAGLADATIIVEASIKGGALITTEIANSYNRDVLAFPGNVNEEFSAGCNFLIRTNRAHLITGIKDLEYLLGWKESKRPESQQISMRLNLTANEKKITDLLEGGSIGIDELALKSNFPQSKLAITILGLEMQGIVVSLPGKIYKLA